MSSSSSLPSPPPPSSLSSPPPSSPSWLPEALANAHFWGGTGLLLTALHTNLAIPYWAGFAVTNTLVRVTLFPFVLQAAHTSARFAKIAPEVQFLVTIFQNDLKKQRQEGASFSEQRFLIWKTLQTVSGIYKLHNVHPLSVFVSPLLQLPLFWYVSVDLRKIINGQDPALAQQLTEGGILWFRDLTESDPWYALPIISGLLLYYNVEVAIGKRSLSGETASKSKMAIFIKDSFQSLAIFMPCFMSQSPAGLQIYLVTSFLFTLGQSAALRNNDFRELVGLPLRGADAKKEEASIAKGFLELKKLEQEAREARGDGEVLGKGVLAVGFETSFAGTNRPSTIQGSGILADNDSSNVDMLKAPHMNVAPPVPIGNAPFVHGISAPAQPEIMESTPTPKEPKSKLVMEEAREDDMERANRGEAPVMFAPTDNNKDAKPKTLNKKRFQKKKGGKKRRK